MSDSFLFGIENGQETTMSSNIYMQRRIYHYWILKLKHNQLVFIITSYKHIYDLEFEVTFALQNVQVNISSVKLYAVFSKGATFVFDEPSIWNRLSSLNLYDTILMSRKIVGLMFPWKLDIDFDWPTSEPVK